MAVRTREQTGEGRSPGGVIGALLVEGRPRQWTKNLVLFAGVIFALSIKNTKHLDDAFAANLIGAMFGGLAEYSTLVFGLKSSYATAFAFYLLSFAIIYYRRARGRPVF